MITPYEQLDILLRADFDAGDCLWMRKEGQEFLSSVQEDFIGSGLYLETQKPLYDWFNIGKEAFRSGAINWSEFEKRGEELAGKLSSNSLQRFRMFYGKSPQNVDKTLSVYREITEEKKSGPLSDLKNRKVTICFGYPESGWMQMVILANFKHHIIWLSDVFDPFPDMVRWLKGITRGLSETLHIDEEGELSYLTTRTLDDSRVELIIESDHAEDSDDLQHVAAHVVAIVERRQFVEELYRQLTEFLKVKYWEFTGRFLDPETYSEEKIKNARKILTEYLDLSEIRDYLDLDKNLLKPLEEPRKME